jgi:hypothetical protein
MIKIYWDMKFFTNLILITFLASAAFGSAFIDFFHARSESSDVKLEWKTSEEINLKNFVIQRRTPQTSYIDLAVVPPKGSNSFYSYIDESAYKGSDLIFVYRLKIVDNNNQVSFSSEVSVSPNVSGVKRTWGSIKAMFR